MNEDFVTLVAEGQSFEVPRDVLAKHSLYFAAAFASGMCESATGRFVFPNLSARQLKLVVQCAHGKFTTWPFEDSSATAYTCTAQAELDALLAVIEAADYLQIALLTRTALNRLSTLLDRLFSPLCIVDHLRHECHIFSACLESWVRLSHVQDTAFTKLFEQHALQHPHLIFKPYIPDPTLQSAVLHLITSTLDSSSLCVPDEGVVLDLVLGWLALLPTLLGPPNVSVVEALLDCVRPGLLSFEARARLHDCWSVHYPNARWKQQFTCEEFANLIRRLPHEGSFSSLRCNMDAEPACLFDARASTPVMVTLLPSFSKNTVEFRLFNLLTGEHRSLEIPTCHLTRLTSESMGDGDFEGRIYLCHPSTDVKRHKSVLVVLYHNPYACTVNGFMWCLATCEAQWLPPLVLPAVENRSVGLSTSGCFRSRRIGVATLPGGLHVYCAEPSNSEIWLHLFRFDASLWQWHLRASKSLFANPLTGIALFTPVDHLSLLAQDGWLYANVEFADRSDPREARIRRHNLHQTSHVRSHFFRFRPETTTGLSVDLLPSPPFLIRIYRILALSSPGDVITTGQTYLFAFGTCSRDQTATHFCFNTETQQWIEWSSTTSVDTYSESQTRSVRPKLQVNLSPEILGFRGLVSVTHLLGHSPCIRSDTGDGPNNQCPETNGIDANSWAPQTIGSVPITHPTSLVLIGRPDHHLCDNKSSSSGIWFHRPQIGCCTATEAADAFEPRKPAFPLPSSLAQILYQHPSPAAVPVANWDNLLRTGEVLRFNDISYPQTSVPKRGYQEPMVKRPFHGINCPSWGGWAASDSD